VGENKKEKEKEQMTFYFVQKDPRAALKTDQPETLTKTNIIMKRRGGSGDRQKKGERNHLLGEGVSNSSVL